MPTSEEAKRKHEADLAETQGNKRQDDDEMLLEAYCKDLDAERERKKTPVEKAEKTLERNEKVKGIFYTTTRLSDGAREAAEKIGIEVYENFKFDKSYPCIKCVTLKEKEEKTYFLPFDPQYDEIKLACMDGFYCGSIEEAERNGFKRTKNRGSLRKYPRFFRRHKRFRSI